ncbi:SUMF1/EgtB/PvdO family nonheme iron enzyme [candidate division WOR-3 bacterium]|nr:SUMF1/EgtB/PvdO family nonheme iron enzyme [candidate division WOR-3 bacterium]
MKWRNGRVNRTFVRTVILLASTVIGITAGTLYPGYAKFNAKPLLKHINLASKLECTVKGDRINIFKGSLDSLPMFFRITDSLGQPVEDVTCTLYVGSRHIPRVTDDFGEVLFWVPPPRPFKKVELIVHSGTPIRIKTDFTSSSEENPKEGFETGQGMLELKDDGIKVLYESSYEEKARELMDALRYERRIIKNTTGMQLEPLKVFVTTNNYRFGIGGWIVSPRGDFDYMKNGTLAHEWVESSLSEYYGVYDDPETRWIGDGLANYIAYGFEKQFCLYSASNSRIDYADSNEVFDLRTWQRGTLRKPWGGKVGYKGYDLAPYFWAKVMDKSGDSLIIAKFLEEFKESDDKSSENAVAILDSLCRLDINDEIVITGKEYIKNIHRYWPLLIPKAEMNYIPGGSFVMGGSTVENCSPVHEARIGPYYLDRYEVTNAEYCKFLNEMGNQKEDGSYWFDESSCPDILKEDGKYIVRKGRDSYPITRVSYFGAAAYARRAGMRLPTEAEWEYAASNGGISQFPWGNDWDIYSCNWKDDGKLDGFERTAPVGSFDRWHNRYLCYDLPGNVSEWVADWYAPYDPADTLNPKGPADGTLKVYRGGSYADGKQWQASRSRRGADPAVASPYIGFRCAMDIPKPEDQ